ncbi:MAG: regulatory protein RecX [Rubrivivax sp.]
MKARALRLLAQREHSRAELERKLWPRLLRDDAADADVDEDDLRRRLQQALDELQQRGLLSDRRTAEALLHAKAPRYGTRRLQALLQAKSLAPELVDETLRRAGETELARALEVWRRRFGTAPADARERARQMRFLLARGFEPAIAQRVLKLSGAGDDPLDEA